MKTLPLIAATALAFTLSVSSHAAGLLQAVNDPQAMARADELQKHFKEISIDEQIALERSLGATGYPGSMMWLCLFADPENKGSGLEGEAPAWCRLIVDELPDTPAKNAKYRKEAQRILSVIPAEDANGKKTMANVRMLRDWMAEPWRDIADAAEADFTPRLEQIGELHGGFASPDEAMGKFVSAVNQRDNASFDLTVNPLDAYRLKRKELYERWRDWLMKCRIVEVSSSREMNPKYKDMTRYASYPLTEVQAKRVCELSQKSGLEKSAPVEFPTTFRLLQIHERWYVIQ